MQKTQQFKRVMLILALKNGKGPLDRIFTLIIFKKIPQFTNKQKKIKIKKIRKK